jgi:hypothetical protein
MARLYDVFNITCLKPMHRGTVMVLEINAIYQLLLQMTPGTMTPHLQSSHCLPIKDRVVKCYINLIIKRIEKLGDLGTASKFTTLFP